VDNAQQAFSSDQLATLHLALPALEALHKAWTTQLSCGKYKDFFPALQAGLTKVEEYYNRMAELDTYTFVMHCIPLLTVPYPNSQICHIVVLNPSQKIEHIRKYWGAEKLDGILECAEKKVHLLFLLTPLAYFVNKS